MREVSFNTGLSFGFSSALPIAFGFAAVTGFFVEAVVLASLFKTGSFFTSESAFVEIAFCLALRESILPGIVFLINSSIVIAFFFCEGRALAESVLVVSFVSVIMVTIGSSVTNALSSALK